MEVSTGLVEEVEDEAKNQLGGKNHCRHQRSPGRIRSYNEARKCNDVLIELLTDRQTDIRVCQSICCKLALLCARDVLCSYRSDEVRMNTHTTHTRMFP